MKRVRKEKTVEELTKLLKNYPVIGIVDMHKMPASSLQKIKDRLREKAIIRMSKKSLITFALKNAGLEELTQYLKGQPGILLTDMDPFKLSFFLQRNKSTTKAKPGDVATKDITVSAGPTDLMAGPAISTLTKVKIPAKVEGGKITIMKDYVVCKKGEEITPEISAALNLLKIEPMEISLKLNAIKYGNSLYSGEALSISEEEIMNDLVLAHQQAVNLSVNTCYITKETVKMILTKAYLNAKSLEDKIKG